MATAPAQAGSIEDHRPATYNMQGSNQGSKWTSDVERLTADHDVVALQEAGSRPNMADGQTVAQDQYGSVQVYRWNIGTDANPVVRQVYYMQTDRNPSAPDGGRVNLAIVTPHEADEVFIVRPGFPGTRAAFGIRIGQTIFYTLHGASGSGNDDSRLLNAMNGQAGQYDWVALGDFNREPHRWNPSGSAQGDPNFNNSYPVLPGRSRIYSSGVATHQSGHELDYAVASRPLPDDWGGSLPLGGLSSDHFPVAVGPLPPGAKGLSKVLVSARSGMGLGTTNAPRINKTRAFGFAGIGKKVQRWSLRRTGNGNYNVVNEASGQCLYQEPFQIAIHPAPNLSGQVFVSDCAASGFSQQWRLVNSTVHSGYMSLVNADSNQCLDVSDSGWVSGQLCGGGTDLSQIWMAGPPGPSAYDGQPLGEGPPPPNDGRTDVTWSLSPQNGTEAAHNYDTMINTLRTAAGNHGFRGNVNQTASDPNRIESLQVDLPGPSGQTYPVTLYFTAHDTRLRGWANGTELFQFNDWDLGSRLHRDATTLNLAGDYHSLQAAFVGSAGGAQPDTAEAPQRSISSSRIVNALFNLYAPRGTREVSGAALTIGTVITEAAHYGAVSHVSMDALGDDNADNAHQINDTEYALYNDWDRISTYAHNVTSNPNTQPLGLTDIGQTLRSFDDVANYVAMIS
ncbi:MAG TPA: endonuclease/exonuclease/phosphatase family protein [Streptosporangiaceae bacterium]